MRDYQLERAWRIKASDAPEQRGRVAQQKKRQVLKAPLRSNTKAFETKAPFGPDGVAPWQALRVACAHQRPRWLPSDSGPK